MLTTTNIFSVQSFLTKKHCMKLLL